MRQLAVRRIVIKNKVSSQEDLLALLEKEGLYATQATLSRDLKELNVTKMHSSDGGYFYSFMEDDSDESPVGKAVGRLTSGVISLEFSSSMAVFKTKPGHASIVSILLDSNLGREIMGTLAGDDTILMPLRDGTDVQNLVNMISTFLPGIKEKVL